MMLGGRFVAADFDPTAPSALKEDSYELSLRGPRASRVIVRERVLLPRPIQQVMHAEPGRVRRVLGDAIVSGSGGSYGWSPCG